MPWVLNHLVTAEGTEHVEEERELARAFFTPFSITSSLSTLVSTQVAPWAIESGVRKWPGRSSRRYDPILYRLIRAASSGVNSVRMASLNETPLCAEHAFNVRLSTIDHEFHTFSCRRGAIGEASMTLPDLQLVLPTETRATVTS